MTKNDTFNDVITLLARLKAEKLDHRLTQIRDDSIAIEVNVPGEHWEIEFMADGTIDLERFRSQGVVDGREVLDKLIDEFSD